jgi:type II secretion system protein H
MGPGGGGSGQGRAACGAPARGFTLLELLVALVLLGLVAATVGPSIAAHRDATALRRSASAVRGLLASARHAAVARRAVVRVHVDPRGILRATADDGTEVGAIPLGTGDLALDSVRLRPATLRFNARGQAAPGSAYLHRGDRRVRIVCNFVGRVREEWSGG